MHGLYWFARFLNIENDVLNNYCEMHFEPKMHASTKFKGYDRTIRFVGPQGLIQTQFTILNIRLNINNPWLTRALCKSSAPWVANAVVMLRAACLGTEELCQSNCNAPAPEKIEKLVPTHYTGYTLYYYRHFSQIRGDARYLPTDVAQIFGGLHLFQQIRPVTAAGCRSF